MSPCDTATSVTLADLQPGTVIDVTFQKASYQIKWRIVVDSLPYFDADGSQCARIHRGRPYYSSASGLDWEPGLYPISSGRMAGSVCELASETKDLAQYGLVPGPDGTWAQGFTLRVVESEPA